MSANKKLLALPHVLSVMELLRNLIESGIQILRSNAMDCIHGMIQSSVNKWMKYFRGILGNRPRIDRLGFVSDDI